jgi:diacylglycerol kinase (ATP)
LIVILNPNAAGGKALQKWAGIEPELRRRGARIDVMQSDTAHPLDERIATLAAGGEREFVAAGGDGTINALVSAVMGAIPEGQRPSITIGAIGLGSSNDFHKPISPGRSIGAIPCAIDPSSAAWRDVGVLRFRTDHGEEDRFFLVNASAGITAEANRLFNHPDGMSLWLKRSWTKGAIFSAAARAMLGFTDIPATLRLDDGPGRSERLSNLAVLKSPHISGDLTFPGSPHYDSGCFTVALLCGAPPLARLRLFHALMHGRLPQTDAIKARTASSVALAAEIPFPVEYDGEVIVTNNARFSVVPRHLRICTC